MSVDEQIDEISREQLFKLATPLTDYFKQTGFCDINAAMLSAQLVELQFKAIKNLLLEARKNELQHVYDSNGLYFYDDKEDSVTVGQRIDQLSKEVNSL